MQIRQVLFTAVAVAAMALICKASVASTTSETSTTLSCCAPQGLNFKAAKLALKTTDTKAVSHKPLKH